MEQREVENEPLIVESICSITNRLLFTPPMQHLGFSSGLAGVVDAPSAVSDAPWQVGRRQDRLMLIIEGKKNGIVECLSGRWL